jgi:hypothetical protein
MQADTFAIFAPGESLTVEQCEYVRGKCKTIAVSDSYRLAPWADALVANDAAWWKARPEAKDLPGLKFSANPNVHDVERVEEHGQLIKRGSNSGVLAMYVARTLGAKRMLLIGFDMKGTHFFGPHTGDLANTTPERFEVFQTYFTELKKLLDKDGIEVLNCTEGSSLRCFPKCALAEAI